MKFRVTVTHAVHAMAMLLFMASPACGQRKLANWPPKIDGERYVYKTVGDRELCLWQIGPTSGEIKSDAKSPAIVFFFGGGWTSGSPEQFLPQAQHLATRGIVAIVADYRVASRDGVKAVSCVEDAKSAIRWVRANASMLGVDPNRICAAGGSAGGHIACCTALIEGFDAEAEDKSVSSVPNALALFNPAVVLAPIDGLPLDDASKKKADGIEARLGVEPPKLSPAHHVRKDLPPCVIFHGEADTTVRIQTVEKFTSLMKESGNRCELHRFPNAPHGFFNLAGDNSKQGNAKKAKANGNNQRRDWHEKSLTQLDEFLVSLEWLSLAKTSP
jgi:acetyl esterase